MKIENPDNKSKLSRLRHLLFSPSRNELLDFAPDIVQLQDKLPPRFSRAVLKVLIALCLVTLVWAMVGRLDIVAVAAGKLVPQTHVKIVQPAEQGIVRSILVKEGETVRDGQVLMRMDAVLSDAEGKVLLVEFNRFRLALRRIEAELGGRQLSFESGDPAELYAQVQAQYNANRRAYAGALDEQRSILERASQDLSAAREVKKKLEQILPHFREQEKAFEKLNRDGYVARLDATDKQRERIEREQDLKAQEFTIKSSQASVTQAEKKIAQITSDYRRQLQAERVEITSHLDKVRQDVAKQQYKHNLLELKAPQAGVVKELATHTVGTVVNPGTILMTLVPQHEPLQAEVWVTNEDIGFVQPGMRVKVKLMPYMFQKYGMMDGIVDRVSVDASDDGPQSGGEPPVGVQNLAAGRLLYKTLVTLNKQHLDSGGSALRLTPGMQVSAEIQLGTRSVIEYVFSPLKKAFHEAARER